MQGYGLWSGPYDRRMQPRVLNFSRPLYIRDVMVRNGDAHKPIWLSEMAWNALPPGSALPPAYGQVTEKQQARYAVQAYYRLQSEWPWSGVANYWFLKQADDREREVNPQYYFRLLEPDFTPLPAYHALSDAAHLPPVMYYGYHQEDHWAVDYTGWEELKDERAVLGSYHKATIDSAQARFTFDGSDLWLVTAHRPDGGWLEVTVDGGPPAVVPQDSAETVYGVKVPVVRNLRQGHHEVHITARKGAVIDGFIVQDRPTWEIRRAVGAAAMVVGLAALGWLMILQQRNK
jgi:hypothetical protein